MGWIQNEFRLVLLLAFLAALVGGCDEERLRQMAKEAADRQAQQNEEMIRLNREVAEGTRRLVAEDAASRKSMVNANQQLHAERQQLHGGWNQLESERKLIAKQRREESLVAIGIREGGPILLVVLIVTLACLMVRSARNDPPSADELVEVLLIECARDGVWRDQMCSPTRQRSPELNDHRSQQRLDVESVNNSSNKESEETAYEPCSDD